LPLGSVVTGVLAVTGWGIEGTALAEHRVLLVVGAVLGVAAFLVTGAANIPRNNAIATLDPDDAASAGAWSSYRRSWTQWNHVRVVLAILAAVLLVVALHR